MSLIHEIRRSFQELGQYSNALHKDLDVNASMRAILEFLAEHGPQTTPEIAKAKSVTRQHIQTIVDQLLDGGFAEQRENPAHKRSHLIALTGKGRHIFSTIYQREDIALSKIGNAVKRAGSTQADISAATATIRALRDAICQQEQHGDAQ
ncbi:MAG: hypothetical protein DHS20C05_22960 [Hyphococcus sp.]|nr:MAG: hypothetical protein DHS20C05_22960 [Marinicaulis sp.]